MDRISTEELKQQRHELLLQAVNHLKIFKHSEDPQFSDQPKPTLYQACNLIGKKLDIEFLPIQGQGSGDVLFELSELCELSRVRSRKVRLSNKWWTKTSDPILGFLGEGQKPIALLPSGRKEYTWTDPENGQSGLVTEAFATKIYLYGYTFFKPLLDSELNFKKMIEFVLGWIKQDWKTSLICSALGALLTLSIPIGTAFLFDSVIPQADRDGMVFLALALLLCMVSGGILQFAHSISVQRISGFIEAYLQTAIWDRLISMSPAFFKKFKAGDLVNRGMGINAIRSRLTNSLSMVFLSSVFACFNLALLFFFNVTFALIAVGLLVFGTIVPGILIWVQLKHERTLAELEGKLGALVFEWVRGITKIRVAGAEARIFAKWSEQFGHKKKFSFKVMRLSNLVISWRTVFPIFSFFILFATMNSVSTVSNALTTGEFLGFLAAFGQCLSSYIGLTNSFSLMLSAVPLFERLMPIIHSIPEGQQNDGQLIEVNGNVDIKNLRFSYEDGGQPVVDDVSLSVKRGQFIAVTGPSGSGKSTLVRLLLGFEQPDSGSIAYEGIAMERLDPILLRKQFGVVLQHDRLQDGTIFEAIAGSRSQDLDETMRVARMVYLHPDLEAMPMGLFTRIGEGGAALSGGQRQRVQLARALYNRPKLLILDEATSSLDNTIQKRIARNLNELQISRIVIAHRLSTLQKADQIIFLENGKIIETGSYDALVARKGRFAEFARLQKP